MTQYINIKTDIIYPVGENIISNIPEIYKMADALKERYPSENITFWVTGSSGSIISAIISDRLCARRMALDNRRIKIIYVKKPGEDNHHDINGCSMPIDGSINVIVDDFTRSFTTIRRIVKEMRTHIVSYFPDCLLLGGSLCAHNMGDLADAFPTIISNSIYFPYNMSICISGNLLLSDHIAEYNKEKDRQYNERWL